MSLNKFCDINVKKGWMNINCHDITCDNFITTNFTAENIGCENLIATENIECKNLDVSEDLKVDDIECTLLKSDNIITEDLNVKINSVDTINFKTPNIGLIGDVLATDGLGNTYWTSNPSPPPTGITYNGVIPAPLGQLFKNSNGIGTTASLSNILDDGTNVNINATNLYSNNYIKNGGSSLEYLMADGSVSTVSSIGSNIYYYQFDTNILTPPPITNGHIQFNTATPNAVVNVFISHLTSGTITDIDPFFTSIQPNNILYIQDRDDSTKWIKFTVISTAITPNSFININVSYLSSPIGFTLFNNNHNIYFSIFSTNTIPVITLLNSGIGNSILNSTTNPNFTTKSISAGSGISISATSTDLTLTNSSPASVITLTNSGTGETLLNSTTNPNFTTKSLIAGSNISLTSTATDITINSTGGGGTSSTYWDFLPTNISNKGALLNNTSYFNMAIVPNTITINTIRFFLPDINPSANTVRFALYKGLITSGNNCILQAQSVATIPTNAIGLQIMTFTAEIGKSLTFQTGDLLWLTFSGSLILATFFGNGSADIESSFLLPTNYTAGFPAFLTTALGRTQTNIRVCGLFNT
jgi:hypothetical protein